MKSLLTNCRYLAKTRQTLFSIFYRNTIICSWLDTRSHVKKNLMEKRMAHSTSLPFTINNCTSKTLEDHCIERILGLFVNIHHYTIRIIQKQNRYRYTTCNLSYSFEETGQNLVNTTEKYVVIISTSLHFTWHKISSSLNDVWQTGID